MRQRKIIWFDQFLDDYKQYTKTEYQISETEILEKFAELETDVLIFTISVKEEMAVDGQARLFRFYLVIDDDQEAMKYEGWEDV
ncbi:hypothetical protein [Enterococcus gilvus]|uniref:Uncharacterized protein n=1 Tax=Enterococcus gilvus ATCC BAA-350 TaxID=1158614 RepID=R2XKQ4_9ENTE|nr:hypothetical protein [Enterococcus gilvus]EOI55484.1 hypothetical protein UKC_02692 [Enterococcus gilvus ATCC BAA-350]EOW81973.1 hypothetical protein I592_01274 [Enterococcus gilvus ATCC BAA-350]OJG43003.1 hypothetical protein RV02_GL002923 [Enterococcus gilvus]